MKYTVKGVRRVLRVGLDISGVIHGINDQWLQ